MHIRIVKYLFIVAVWVPKVYISVVKVKFRFDITQYSPICLDNFSKLYFNEKIERVNMLLDEPFYFEKRREKVPFVLLRLNKPKRPTRNISLYLGSVNRIGQRFPSVKWLEKRIEALSRSVLSAQVSQ